VGLIGLFIAPVGLVPLVRRSWSASREAVGARTLLGDSVVLLFGFLIGTVAGIYLLAKIWSDWQAEIPEHRRRPKAVESAALTGC